MRKSILGGSVVLFLVLAWMSATSFAAFPFERERVWVPCEFGAYGICQPGNPEYCFLIQCG